MAPSKDTNKLFEAILDGNTEKTAILLKKIKPQNPNTLRSMSGKSLLHTAIASAQPRLEVINLLIDCGMSWPVDVIDSEELYRACWEKRSFMSIFQGSIWLQMELAQSLGLFWVNSALVAYPEEVQKTFGATCKIAAAIACLGGGSSALSHWMTSVPAWDQRDMIRSAIVASALCCDCMQCKLCKSPGLPDIERRISGLNYLWRQTTFTREPWLLAAYMSRSFAAFAALLESYDKTAQDIVANSKHQLPPIQRCSWEVADSEHASLRAGSLLQCHVMWSLGTSVVAKIFMSFFDAMPHLFEHRDENTERNVWHCLAATGEHGSQYIRRFMSTSVIQQQEKLLAQLTSIDSVGCNPWTLVLFHSSYALDKDSLSDPLEDWIDFCGTLEIWQQTMTCIISHQMWDEWHRIVRLWAKYRSSGSSSVAGTLTLVQCARLWQAAILSQQYEVVIEMEEILRPHLSNLHQHMPRFHLEQLGWNDGPAFLQAFRLWRHPCDGIKPSLLALVDLGVSVSVALPDTKETALHLARTNDQVQFLLQRGADIWARDAQLRLPLHTACLNAAPQVVDALLCVCHQHRLPHVGAASGQWSKQMVRATDATGQTPWHCLARSTSRLPHKKDGENPVAAIAKLLLDAQVDPTQRDMYGRTGLFYAAQQGCHVIVSGILTSHDAISRSLTYAALQISDRQGMMPLDAAVVATLSSRSCRQFPCRMRAVNCLAENTPPEREVASNLSAMLPSPTRSNAALQTLLRQSRKLDAPVICWLLLTTIPHPSLPDDMPLLALLRLLHMRGHGPAQTWVLTAWVLKLQEWVLLLGKEYGLEACRDELEAVLPGLLAQPAAANMFEGLQPPRSPPPTTTLRCTFTLNKMRRFA